MRRIIVAASGTLVLLAASAMPLAIAQEEYPLTFQVTTTGGDCSGVTFAGEWGPPNSEFRQPQTLTDPDGDRVFTNTQSVDVAEFPEVVARIVNDRVLAGPVTIDVTGGRTLSTTYTCGDVDAGTAPTGGVDTGAGGTATPWPTRS